VGTLGCGLNDMGRCVRRRWSEGPQSFLDMRRTAIQNGAMEWGTLFRGMQGTSGTSQLKKIGVFIAHGPWWPLPSHSSEPSHEETPHAIVQCFGGVETRGNQRACALRPQ